MSANNSDELTAFPEVEPSADLTTSLILMCFLLPTVCVLGIGLNSFCIIVFSRRAADEKSSFFVYLSALCVFDLLQLGLSVVLLPAQSLEQWYASRQETGLSSYVTNRIINYMVPVAVPLLYMASYASVWTITLITFHRFKAICSDGKSSPVGTTRARLEILVVAAFAVSVNISSALDWKLTYDSTNNITVVVPTKIAQDRTFRLAKGIEYLISQYFLPLVINMTLNFKMMIHIHRTQKRVRSACQTKRVPLKSTFMMAVVILAFIACRSCGLYCTIWLLINPSAPSQNLQYWTLNDVGNLLVNTNSTVNPFIYLIFTRRFQQLMRRGTSRKVPEEFIRLCLASQEQRCIRLTAMSSEPNLYEKSSPLLRRGRSHRQSRRNGSVLSRRRRNNRLGVDSHSFRV